jgi:predicted amidohydrolase
MKAGYYQFRPVFGEVDCNVKKIITALADVTADLIVLPELALTGYLFADRSEVEALAEEIHNSVTVSRLVDLCRRRKFYLVTGFAEKSNDKCYNSAILIGPKGVIHTYRKLHLFYHEKNLFDPGDFELSVQTIGSVRIGMMICFDWIFPEAARILSLQGADLICHPSNLVLGYCQQTMISRCLENHIFAITANRFGKDHRPHDELRFTGRSQVVGPKGELIHRGPAQREELYICDLDIRTARQKKITPLNDVISDRRPEFYSRLSKSR